jgi:hypothetical protein
MVQGHNKPGHQSDKTVHIKGAEYFGVVLINTPEVEDEVEEVEDVCMALNRGCFHYCLKVVGLVC